MSMLSPTIINYSVQHLCSLNIDQYIAIPMVAVMNPSTLSTPSDSSTHTRSKGDDAIQQ